MSKPALGRGLGELMSGERVAGRHASEARDSNPKVSVGGEPTSLDSPSGAAKGMGKLLVGSKAIPKSAEDPVAIAKGSAKAGPLPGWFLLAADILLLVVAMGIVLTGDGPIGPARGATAVVMVALGALMAVLAIRAKST